MMNKKKISDKEVLDSLMVQQHQGKSLDAAMSQIDKELSNLSGVNQSNLSELANLLAQAGMYCSENNISLDNVSSGNADLEIFLSDEEKGSIILPAFNALKDIEITDNWDKYIEQVHKYAKTNNIDLTKDPYQILLSQSQRVEIVKRINEEYTLQRPNCDKYDYIIAAFCGVATGLFDVLFVGKPGDSQIGDWADKKIDNVVINFTKIIYQSDKNNPKIIDQIGLNLPKNVPDQINSAIGYLEKRFKVNYDHRHTQDVGGLFKMGTTNHHLKSLSHCPDIVGLIFSLLDQFQGKATFISDGKLIRIDSDTMELYGGNIVAKIFCGVCNWLGHIMSDMAGSSGSRGQNGAGRGSGVPIPFFEMFQFCDFGEFGKDRQSLSTIFVRVFQEGYDFRHGVAMSIPVVINELLVRIIWTVKSKYYHKRSWTDSLPFGNRPELRRMLLVAHGSLCLVDGVDAAIRSGLQPINFILHINMIAWSRFAFAALKEIRMYYRKITLDTDEMDRALNVEWAKIAKEIGINT